MTTTSTIQGGMMNARNPKILPQDIASAFRNWGRMGSIGDSPLGATRFVRTIGEENADRRALEAALANCLDRLLSTDPVGTDILRRRFIGREPVLAVAHAIGLSADQVNRRQREAIGEIARIFEMEEARHVYHSQRRLMLKVPPASYAALVGVDEALLEIRGHIGREGRGVVITGIGGIGKTALADAAARAMIAEDLYDEIFWLRLPGGLAQRVDTDGATAWVVSEMVRQIGMGFLAGDRLEEEVGMYLLSHFSLVVIDDIESSVQLQSLLPLAGKWEHQCQLMLTSRYQPGAQSQIPVVQLAELDWASSWELMKRHALTVGLMKAEGMSEVTGREIYERIGGNPLALRMATGLLKVFPVRALLEGLDSGSMLSVESLYDRIFRASWQTIGENSRAILMAMYLAGESGAGILQLKAITELKQADLNRAIEELAQHSLLEFRSEGDEPQYGLHRLTLAFLESLINEAGIEGRDGVGPPE